MLPSRADADSAEAQYVVSDKHGIENALTCAGLFGIFSEERIVDAIGF